jgi:cysteine desulfurase
MMANNETGVLQPVEEIGRIAAEAGVYFHSDAVQAAGKFAIDVKKIGCHALSISGHKMHAPQGVGALYVRMGTKLEPLFYGGRHERSRRAGTENVPGIVALGKAAELAMHAFERGEDRKMSAMRDRLQQGILAQVEDAGVNGSGAPRVPNTTNIYFDQVDGESMVIALDLKGMAVSTGSACSSGAIEPSHVLIAMGLQTDRARASIRLSLGKQNTEDEIDLALALLPETVARLRELGPVSRRAQFAGSTQHPSGVEL